VATEGEQSGTLRLLGGRERFPLRAADRAEKDGVSVFAGLESLGRKGLAGGVDGRTADELMIEIKSQGKLTRNRFEDAESLGHDFRTDAISGEDGDIKLVLHVWAVSKQSARKKARHGERSG
jgi:hypothetical protein